MNCELHASSLANLHVMLSIENCEYFEDVLNGCLDGLDTNVHRRDSHHPLYVDEQGLVRAPQFAGLAPAPNLEAMESRVIETVR